MCCSLALLRLNPWFCFNVLLELIFLIWILIYIFGSELMRFSFAAIYRLN